MIQGYKTFISAIDMFFWKFHDHKSSEIRMETLPLRYRGCVALTVIGTVADAADLPARDLSHFIFTTGQEITDVFGYFPYRFEFGAFSKSTYSLSVNPTLCLWIPIIECCLGLERSKNVINHSLAIDIGRTYTNTT
ncbi:hypothetical protein TNCV_1884101 [Trichonephila clavipes]|nr:hypothetical protein TNCV_1884101 [Trichonephila clavipes]